MSKIYTCLVNYKQMEEGHVKDSSYFVQSDVGYWILVGWLVGRRASRKEP